MEFEVLGPIKVRDGRTVTAPKGRLQRTLLGILLLRASRPVSVDVLTDALWPDSLDPRAAGRLQLHVHRLRGVLGDPDRLRFGSGGYLLDVGEGELDAARMEALFDEADRVALTEPAGCAALVREGLALWQSLPYGGLDVPLLVDESARLTERKLAAVEQLYEAELECGRHALVATELTDLVRHYPLRERLYALLMTALYRSQRQAEALEVYRDVRRRLVAEVGLEPGSELRELERGILRGRPAGVARVPAQLPHDVPSFFGRTAELAELDGVAATGSAQRICVLAGAGGMGKTALAVHWAHRARSRFPSGQLFVDLGGYGQGAPECAEEVLAGFLRALGVAGQAVPKSLAERAARFRTLVDGKRMLLVLDNAHSAEQILPLLPGTASCFVLVTSRDSLAGLTALHGAHRIPVGELAEDAAHELLTELAGEGLASAPHHVEPLTRRCARLPLALRLVAEAIRLRDSTVAEVAAELDSEQGRLDLLEVEGHPQASVRAVFSWSYHRLDEDAALLFRLCGLFPGKETEVLALAALAGISEAETRDLLGLLLAAHLVDEVEGGRYRQHDLLRAYAAELVAEEHTEAERDAALCRLFDYYTLRATRMSMALDPQSRLAVEAADAGTEPAPCTRTQAMDWFEAERSNLVAAVDAAVTAGRREPASAISAALLSYFYLSKHWDDWIRCYRTALVAAEGAADSTAQAVLLNGLGVAYDDIGRFADAIACHGEAVSHYAKADDRKGQAWNLNNLGVVYDNIKCFPEALDCYTRALELFRIMGDERGIGIALNNLGDVYRQSGQYEHASRLLHEALEVQRGGSDGAQRMTLCTLGDLHRDSARMNEAVADYETALEINVELGDRWRAATVLMRLGEALAALGRKSRAEACLREALAVLTEFGDPSAEQVKAKLTVLEAGRTPGLGRAITSVSPLAVGRAVGA
ncbi:hypothetical protein BAY61_25650 [Prauserella marina]|uniref:DNA-binding transcriptional activator of the SARP family n=1 Tax=Prauserella marina TaxID=530584 RepID=A0A222VV88_9PSEU|nr:BTAD domain-containing putative transcriptional regulator [Prauserella marina]ASR37824.1 hypothetical protein BAY61_25650 [Prauserella marina]PWV75788.1 DNA-binding SARP family transcriptional activator [Prauserella marina]SDD26147.1 DNA-binding transcriptional activator of the SARP family [Prauserella marina]